MDTEPVYMRFPKVRLWRRFVAFLIDYCVVALGSSLAPALNSGGIGLGRVLLFVVLWLLMRVVVAIANQGQSLGRWALDQTVVDVRFGRVPLGIELLKREVITGIGAVFATIGSSNLTPGHGAGMLLLLPLAGDCSLASMDPLMRQAFHDRLANTIIVGTRRGYSLDLKVKRWYFLARGWLQKILARYTG